MVMLYGGCLKKLTTKRYSVYPVMFYSVSCMGYNVGYVVFQCQQLILSVSKQIDWSHVLIFGNP
jgi:hypothetical protein